MLSTTATLEAAAQAATHTPHVRLTISDRHLGVRRIHLDDWYDGTEPAGPAGAAVPADGSLVRARIDPATNTLYVSRVASPTEASTFSSWTSLDTALEAAGLGLHAAGARVLIAYYDGSDVLVRESTDSGASWGSATSVISSGDVTAVSCATRDDGEAIAVYAVAGEGVITGVEIAEHPAGGSWGDPDAWTRSLSSINALVASDLTDWTILVSGEDDDGQPGCWSTRYGSGVSGPPGNWAPLRTVALASVDLDVTYRATGAADVGAPRAFLVESYGGAGAFDRAMLATGIAGSLWDDGQWAEPVPLPHDGEWGVAAAEGGDHLYLVAADRVWHADAGGSTEVDLTAAVLAARYQASKRDEQLRATISVGILAGAGGEAELPMVGDELAFSPGYVTASGVEYVSGRRLWVTSVTRRRETGEVEVTAEGVMGRLARWRLGRQRTWAAGDATITAIVTALAEAAGVDSATTGDGTSTAASTLTPGFTARAGESPLAALGRLLERVPDQIFGREYTLLITEFADDEDADYTYGVDHPIAELSVHDRDDVPALVRVLGTAAAGEAVGEEGGTLAVVVDPAITDGTIAADRAAAVLRRAVLAEHLATLEAAPHPGHEPGDVVAITDLTLGLADDPYRVLEVHYDYDTRRPRGRYTMQLQLGAV